MSEGSVIKNVTSEKSHDELAKSLADKLALLSLATSNPATLLRKLAEYAAAHPDAVDTAYWFTLDGSKDIGFQVRLWTKETGFSRFLKKFSFGGLMGVKTAGMNISTPIFESANGMRLEIGIGATTAYDKLGSKWNPVASIAFRIPLS